jgi:hypothetical protein
MSTLLRVIPAIDFFVSKSLNIVYYREAIKDIQYFVNVVLLCKMKTKATSQDMALTKHIIKQ